MMPNPDQSPHRVDVLDWQGEGFKPLVKSGDWIVALMNWEQRFDVSGIGDVERHNETDEVFMLSAGPGALFVVTDGEVQLYDMQPGRVYNVTPGTWHSVIGTRETTWIIVESQGTDATNTDHRQLTPSERVSLRTQFPDWISEA
jgi:mannose-6-phosphate isomerase-like protein (cupin superfamily)